MGLYEDIKRKEKELESLKRTIDYLEKRGFDVTGEIPSIGDEAKSLIFRYKMYEHNPLIQRIKRGEKASDIIDEVRPAIVEKRKDWKVYFREKEKLEHNQRVNELEELVGEEGWLLKFDLLYEKMYYGIKTAIWGSFSLTNIMGIHQIYTGIESRQWEQVIVSGFLMSAVTTGCYFADKFHRWVFKWERGHELAKEKAEYIDKLLTETNK